MRWLYLGMDQTFSKAAFVSSPGDWQTKQKALSHAIAQRIHVLVEREFAAIADELHSLGHRIDVKAEYNPEFAAWDYSSNPERLNDTDAHLSFHYDCQVTCIFR
jgi:hypothetical protein